MSQKCLSCSSIICPRHHKNQARARIAKPIYRSISSWNFISPERFERSWRSTTCCSATPATSSSPMSRRAASWPRRSTRRAAPTPTRPEPINAGALFAMGLIDELSHALVARYRKEIDPAVLSEAVRWFAAQDRTRQARTAPPHLHRAVPQRRRLPRQTHRRRMAARHHRRPAQPRSRARRASAALDRQHQSRVQALPRALRRRRPQAADRLHQRHRRLPQLLRHAPARRARNRQPLRRSARALARLARLAHRPARLHPRTLGALSRRRPPPHPARHRRPPRRRPRHLDALPSARPRPVPPRRAHAGAAWASSATSSSATTRFAPATTLRPPATRPRSMSTKPSPPTRPGCPTSS